MCNGGGVIFIAWRNRARRGGPGGVSAVAQRAGRGRAGRNEMPVCSQLNMPISNQSAMQV